MEVAGLEIQIGAKVDGALRAFNDVTKSAGVTATAITAAMTKASGSIDKIPVATAKVSVSFDKIDAALAGAFNDAGISNLTSDFEGLGQAGPASISKLTASLDMLQAAQAKATDPTAFKIYQDAIDEVSVALSNINTANVSTGGLSKDLGDAAIAANNLDSSLGALSTAGLPMVTLDKSVQKLLLSFSELPAELQDFAQAGKGSIIQFAAAFDFLRQKAAGSVDPQELTRYNAALKSLGTEMTNAKASFSGFETKTVSLREEILLARNSLDSLTQSGTASASEIAAAGKELGELKGRLHETQIVSNAFDPVQKFKGLTNVLRLGSGAFAGLTGAMSLFAGESEKSRQEFVKLQGVFLLTEGINQILESGEALKALKLQAISTFSTIKLQAIAAFGTIGAALVATGIGAAILAIGYLAARENEAGKEAERAAKLQEDYNDAIAGAQASVNTELTKLSALVQVARDVSLSDKERKNAIDALNKSYPELQNNLTLENINSKETTTAINGLADSYIRKAKAQALGNILTKASEDLFKAQNSSLSDNVDTIDAIIAGIKNFGRQQSAADDLIKKGAASKSKAIAGLEKTVQEASDALGALTQAQSKAGDFKDVPTKTKKDLETLSKVFAELQKQILFLNTLQINVGVDEGGEKLKAFENALQKIDKVTDSVSNKLAAVKTITEKIELIEGNPEEKIKAIEVAIQSLIDLKVDPKSTIIQKLFGDIGEINVKQLIDKFSTSKVLKLPEIPVPPDVIIPVRFDFPQLDADYFQLKGAVEQMSASLGLELPVNFQSLNFAELTGIKDKLKEAYDELNKTNKQYADDFQESSKKLLRGAAVDAFAAFGQGLGTGIAGGGFENIFKGVFSVIGEALKALGAQMIGLSPVILAIKLALKTLNPALLLPAGIALEVIGSLITSAFSKVSKFGEGGIVTGPTFGIFGEKGTEIIMPLDRLKDFIKPNDGFPDFLPRHQISGDNLILWYERAVLKRGRTF